MMHLFLNGLAASAGGGITYLRNVVPHLGARPDTHTTVALSPRLRQEFGDFRNITFLELECGSGAAARVIREQRVLPDLIRQSRAEVLISAGNFALRNSPVPQVLLSRNSLYTSANFFRDLRSRREYAMWLDTRVRGTLARRSIAWADCTVAPSQAFAEELQLWTGRKITVIPHGFAPDLFFGSGTLPLQTQRQIDRMDDAFRMLFVSHYNYYRNFETLLRAVPLLQARLGGRRVKLFLTCALRSESNPGQYRAENAAALARQPGIAGSVVQLGTVPYHLLHHVYQACDVYVTAAYAESFAHPLVEAMASGLPVVASDLPVHREMCAGAALYFPRFSPQALAERVSELADSEELRRTMGARGLQRSKDFSWSRHVQQLLDLAAGMTTRSQRTMLAAAS